jgi:putative FmdB family regulatory protein
MPIYEYECRGCGRTFEKLVQRGVEPTACPTCEGEDFERVISLPGIQTETTRGQAMNAAKKRDANQAEDRMRERIKYEESHHGH